MKTYKRYMLIMIFGLALGCSEDDVVPSVQNDFLLKSQGPAIVGDTVEFAYAAATLEGHIQAMYAKPTIPGGIGTGFDSHAYSVDAVGNEVGIELARPQSEGESNAALFNVDTNAVTLRYYYVVPESARGLQFSIQFSVETTSGKTTSLASATYNVAKLKIEREVVMTDNDKCYFSLARMKAYTEQEVIDQGIADQIDFRYIYDALNPDGIPYGHALVSLGTEERYLNGRIIPSSFGTSTSKIEKRAFVNDMQLSEMLPATFVDDIDLETVDLTQTNDFILGINTRNSAFVETSDGRYRGFLFFKSARSRTLNIGVKLMEMEQ